MQLLGGNDDYCQLPDGLTKHKKETILRPHRHFQKPLKREFYIEATLHMVHIHIQLTKAPSTKCVSETRKEIWQWNTNCFVYMHIFLYSNKVLFPLILIHWCEIAEINLILPSCFSQDLYWYGFLHPIVKLYYDLIQLQAFGYKFPTPED